MTMSQSVLALSLLGTLEIKLGETPVTLATAKARALLVYLAVTGQPHRREKLLDLLWSDLTEAKARRNLTATLSSLRKQVGDYIIVESDTIAFDFAQPHWIDSAEFTNYLNEAQSTHDTTKLREAVSLYHGDFLAGFSVKNAFVFEEWVLTEAGRLREQIVQALLLLVEAAIDSNETAIGLDHAARLLVIEPWMEQAHRYMMVLYAQSGRIEAALAQYATCRDVLAEELGVEVSAETSELYERLQSGILQVPHNLPPQPNAFIGRQKELQLAASNLRDPACRLLTIVGAGGIGKSRLAIEVARKQLTGGVMVEGGYTDGIYFVPLATIDSAEATTTALVSAIAATIGFDFHTATSPRQQLLTFLQDKAQLLLLDNFEQFLAHNEAHGTLDFLVALLHKAHRVNLLITSRELLKLQEEWVLSLEGLDYPSEASMGADGQLLEQYSAIALFMKRAHQARIGFELTSAEAPDVIRLCQLLEGLPLGVELAASWLRVLSCSEIVAEIESGLEALEATTRNLPQRHRSLQAVIDYSWRLLSSQEQRLYNGCRYFAVGLVVLLQPKLAKCLYRSSFALPTSRYSAVQTMAAMICTACFASLPPIN